MFVCTPGPTQPHPALFQFLEEAKEDGIFSLSHRSPFFQDFFAHTQKQLKALLGITHPVHIFFLGSATECMERLIENCVEKESLHFVNGAFSKRMYDCAVELHKTPFLITEPLGKGFCFDSYLLPEHPELITLTHCETSGCTEESLEDIYTLKQRYPNTLLALDVVTTVPYATLDFSYIDAAFFSVQKGFGLPAGMGVLILNDRCIKKAKLLQERGVSIGTYHNFLNLLSYEQRNFTPETPNILGIYLLGKACSYYLKEILSIRIKTKENAQLLYQHLEEHPVLAPFVKDPEKRSETVIGVATPFGSHKLIDFCKAHGYLIGSGYGEDKETLARIANFPMHREEIMGLIKVLERFKDVE